MHIVIVHSKVRLSCSPKLIALFIVLFLVSESEQLPQIVNNCPEDLLENCNLQCPNGDYRLDENGCPTCACATKTPERPKIACPMVKCRANCGDLGYVKDENGCQTCRCVADARQDDGVETKDPVPCSRVMCRMFCVNGFRRDANGCEVCQCNEEPQPCPLTNCQNSCPNGYRKDYSRKLRGRKRKIRSRRSPF